MNKENEAGHNLVFAPEQNLKAVRNSAKELRKEMNCNDEFLSKAIDDAKSKLKEVIKGSLSECKEWPCVNDEVSYNNGISSGVVIGIHDDAAWIKMANGNMEIALINQLKKPKTAEEALRDDIAQTISDDVYHGVYDKKSLEVFANALITKYNITPKD